MTEQELELWRLKARVTILERVALKSTVLLALSQTLDLEQAIEQSLQGIQLTDEIVQELYAGLDPATVALYEGELREIVGNLHAFLNSLRSFKV